MKKTFLILLVVLAILSIGAVSASQNLTANDILSNDDDFSDIDEYNTIITAKIDKNNNKINVEVKDPEDSNSNFIVDKLKYKFDDGNSKSIYNYEDGKNGAEYTIPFKLNNGKHTVEINIQDSYYKAKPLILNFNLDLKTPTVKAAKCTTTDKQITLKATVKCEGKNVNEGKVIFKIKGKEYTVNVKNGVATKKLTIANGYHSYKATFKSGKYYTKSSSNYAIKGNKYYTIKRGGLYGGSYTVKIPFKQYLKLVEAKRNGDFAELTIKTGEKAKYATSKDIYETKTVYKWKQIKVMDYEEYWDDGTSYSYSTEKYYSDGWTYVGGSSKTYSDGYEHFSIFKKKVKTTEKVYVDTKTTYSKQSYPVSCSIFINENGKLTCRWEISKGHQLKAYLTISHWSGKL